jgi:Acyl-CoA reductase (LuxC)
MVLQKRIDLLVELGKYMASENNQWLNTKDFATAKNGWFAPAFINLAITNIVSELLQKDILENFADQYKLAQSNDSVKKVGIVMAGNIPLVGFHDFLCCFLSGHQQLIKLSEKDEVLLKHLVDQLIAWDAEVATLVQFDTMLKNCDAYIATGSNNTARYFEQYFAKYPHIIRKNRTSIGVLTGTESEAELDRLADDVHLYYGLGCRNVTKIFVLKDYDFVPLLTAFKKYKEFADHNKYKNNYDYNLAIHILNKVYYMTNDSILLIENEANFSPISQLNYEFYNDIDEVKNKLTTDETVQCIVGKHFIPFGGAQQPNITQYADGVDTMAFLVKL